MFDLRLGLALGKSLGEVRNLPLPEVQLWRTYYKLEPWGWFDSEYRTAAVLMMLYNTRLTKTQHAKDLEYFFRDMPELLEQRYNRIIEHRKMRQNLLNASKEEKRQMIARAFRGIAKEVKIDNSGDDSS